MNIHMDLCYGVRFSNFNNEKKIQKYFFDHYKDIVAAFKINAKYLFNFAIAIKGRLTYEEAKKIDLDDVTIKYDQSSFSLNLIYYYPKDDSKVMLVLDAADTFAKIINHLEKTNVFKSLIPGSSIYDDESLPYSENVPHIGVGSFMPWEITKKDVRRCADYDAIIRKYAEEIGIYDDPHEIEIVYNCL